MSIVTITTPPPGAATTSAVDRPSGAHPPVEESRTVDATSPAEPSGAPRAPQPIVTWISPTVAIIPWEDPRLVGLGHDLRGDYVERFWLGVLGPATTLLLRRLARGFTERPTGYRIDLADTAQAMGLGRGIGHSSMIGRTLERACQFGACRIESEASLAVRTLMPTLTSRQLRRLPDPVQRSHSTWLSAHGLGAA